MKITNIKSIESIEDFNCEHSTVLGLQSKVQSNFNLQLVKVVTNEIYIGMDKRVALFRVSLDTMKMYLDSEGTLEQCLKNLDGHWNVYSFKNFDDFYKWYIRTKK
jgi:hypothetical protein